MKRDAVPFTAEVCFLLLIFGSIFALVLSGCGRSLPAQSAPAVYDVTTIEPTPDPAPAIVSPEPEPAVELPSVVKTVSAKHTCKACGDDCQCDICCCDEAKMVNGVWHRRWKGVLYYWTEVRCFGPNIPCEMGWVPVPDKAAAKLGMPNRSAVPKSSQSACSSCQSGTVRRYQPMTRRSFRLFGR